MNGKFDYSANELDLNKVIKSQQDDLINLQKIDLLNLSMINKLLFKDWF